MIEHDKNYSGRKIQVLQEIVIAGDSLNHHTRNRYPAGTILTVVSWRPEGFMSATEFCQAIFRPRRTVELLPAMQSMRNHLLLDQSSHPARLLHQGELQRHRSV